MTYEETQQIKQQIQVLKELQENYGHKTLSNILQGLEKRLQEFGNNKLQTLKFMFV